MISMISARFSSCNYSCVYSSRTISKTTVEIDPLDWETTVPVNMCNIINNNAWQFINQFLVFVMTKLEPKPNFSLIIMA